MDMTRGRRCDLYTYMYKCRKSLRASTYVCARILVLLHIHLHTYTYKGTYKYNICQYIYIHIYIYINIHMHLHKYMHMHTSIHNLQEPPLLTRYLQIRREHVLREHHIVRQIDWRCLTSISRPPGITKLH